MQTTRYLIVGGGLTADAACAGIRDLDPDGPIVVVGDEPHPPYLRPPLSKALWKGEDESTIWRGTADLGAQLQPGRRIVGLDLKGRTARDDRGESYAYERLLLATGGRPRRLPFGGEDVVYFRTVDDYRRLRGLADGGASFVVIGAGFIGSEIAAALALNGSPVTLVFPEPGIGARIFPPTLSLALIDYYRDRGVNLLPEASVSGIERHDTGTRVTLEDGRALDADAVVAGIGIEPNVELAERGGPAGLERHRRRLARPRRWTEGRLRRRRRRPIPGRRARDRAPGRARGPREEPRPPGGREHGRREPSPTSTCPSSTPICSTSATRPSASSTRGSTRLSSWATSTSLASSTTSTRSGEPGACSCGTSSVGSTTPAS